LYFLLLSYLRKKKDVQLKSMVELIYVQGYSVGSAYEVIIQSKTITLRALQIRLKNRSEGIITFTDLMTSYKMKTPGRYGRFKNKKVKLL